MIQRAGGHRTSMYELLCSFVGDTADVIDGQPTQPTTQQQTPPQGGDLNSLDEVRTVCLDGAPGDTEEVRNRTAIYAVISVLWVAAVAFAGSQGAFQLNVYKPVLIYSLLQSIQLIGDACSGTGGTCQAFDGCALFNCCRCANIQPVAAASGASSQP